MSDSAKSKSTARRASGKLERLLGPGASALLGAASAFFCFAMPAAIVFRAVAAIGMPPAVADARLALAIGIGLIVGAATWFGFAALDRPARAPAGSFGAPEGEADLAPILRRADAHPDAPPRRPIFAGSDLGTPLDLIDPLPADWSAPRHPPEPSTPHADVRADVTVDADAAIDAEFEAIIPTPLSPPPSQPTPALALAAFSPDVTPVTRFDSLPPAEAKAPVQAVPSLSALMARLETGLARKALALAGAEANVTALKREIRPIGGSLRAAVDELHDRTAARR